MLTAKKSTHQIRLTFHPLLRRNSKSILRSIEQISQKYYLYINSRKNPKKGFKKTPAQMGCSAGVKTITNKKYLSSNIYS
jgi:galactose mutarotase-like enzyme